MGVRRVLLIDSSDARREARASRLRAQGYAVQDVADAAHGAEEALAAPPRAVVAQLWEPSISGVQLSRLLRSEPSTCDVPVILCGDDEPRSRFWAERAGAAAYVANGRTGELMRALARVVAQSPAADDGFFTQLSDGSLGIRDRIARHLDAALFEAVIAAELRALASVGNFEKLFDRLAQFVSQVTRYRFIALSTGGKLAVHRHPDRQAAVAMARKELGVRESVTAFELVDEDAAACDGDVSLKRDVPFADATVGTFVIAPCPGHENEAATLLDVIARELGGALKIADLIAESDRAAATDALTRLSNRRSFSVWMTTELARVHRYGQALSLLMLDVDHFKNINDTLGHPAGDEVLRAMADVLRAHVRHSDLAARWGGEEFIIAYTNTDPDGARVAAERLRVAIETAEVVIDGQRVRFTASLGLAGARAGESVEQLLARADAAMYASKSSGRNRLTVSHTTESQIVLAAS